MATQARIDSIETLELFRSRLIVFTNKMQLQNGEIGNEVRRTRAWLQTEQRMKWEGEIRRRRQILDQAEQELLSARMSSLHGDLSGRQNAVRKAARALAEAEDKLRKVREWSRNFDAATDPLVRKLDGLGRLIDSEMPKAIAFLSQTQRILAGYLETAVPAEHPAGPPPEEPGQP
ncbi:MAG TPA: hypothetical protein VIS74_02835 [Chthoniobacterales bacterium]